jgi:hypothetical protein
MAKKLKKITISINHHICPIFHAENNLLKFPFHWADFDPSWAYPFGGLTGENGKTEALCHSRYSTIKIPPCSRLQSIGANFTSLHRKW